MSTRKNGGAGSIDRESDSVVTRNENSADASAQSRARVNEGPCIALACADVVTNGQSFVLYPSPYDT